MSDDDESGEKEHEPSQKKLEDARKKGEFAKSVELSTAASYGGMLLVILSMGAGSIAVLGTALTNLVGQSDRLSQLFFSGSGQVLTGGIVSAILRALGPWFLIPALAALLAILAQKSLVVAPDKLMPKLSRISPISNAKNKFGRGGLFEFAKSFFKLVVFSVVLWVFLLNKLPEIVGTINLSPAMAMRSLSGLLVEFLFIVLGISAAIGVVDYLWQHKEHLRKNRMSRKEMMDENKSQEGDPHVKQQRRQKGYEIAMNQMLADVPDADVVIVNPLHYAVALKWDRAGGRAPHCVAKGVDEIAARIREAASEAGVPIHRDPPTARALFAAVSIGQEIEPGQYQAVAAAIRFSEAMRAKAKTVWKRDA